jgi:tetratricopeptide (TPR) repeat protein
MMRDEKIKLALVGACGGATAGTVVVLLTWLFLPGGTNPVPAPAEPPTASTTPDARAVESAPGGVAATEVAPTTAVRSTAATRSRSEDQAEIYRKLKNIGLALHAHYDNFRTFAPPLPRPDDAKGTRLSWRVHMLPYLDQKPLYEQFQLDEPWDSPHNQTLLDTMPDAFRIGAATDPVTRFRVFTGPRVMFDVGKKLAVRDVTDGSANTIHAVVVGPDRAVPWTKPDEMELDEKDPAAAFGTLPDGVFDCLMGDGQSLTLPADVAPELLVALATPSGGEVVDAGSLRRGIGVTTKSSAAKVSASTSPAPANGGVRNKGGTRTAGPTNPKLVKPTESPDLRKSLQKLEQIGMAIITYTERYGSKLPFAGDPDTFIHRDRPKLSWRVHLLPYLQQGPLYDAFHLDEPWDSPHNLPLVDRMPEIYRAVSSETNVTRLKVFYGDKKMLFGTNFHTIRNATDGFDNTIMVVQTGWDRAVPWTKPEDIEFDPAHPLAALGTLGKEPILCSTVLHKTLVLPPDIDAQTFAALVTPAGGEIVNGRRYHKQWHEVSASSSPASPVVQDVQKRSRQVTKLEEIGRAMRKFHDSHGRFPPNENPAGFDNDGRSHLSWRVRLLPFLDQVPLYNQFKLNEPWDSPNNRPLVDKMPDVFQDDDGQATSTTTRFVVMTGPDTPFAGKFGLRRRDFKDGASTTILVIRVGKDKAVVWSKPDDAVFNPSSPLDALGSLGTEELMFSMVDGSIKRLKPPLSPELFAALVTVAGRESIETAALDRSDFAAALKSAPAAKSKPGPAANTTEPSAPAKPKLSATAIAEIGQRAAAAGRRGDWQKAADEYERLLAAKPVNQMAEADHHIAYEYAPVLLQLEKKDEYANLCRLMIGRFGNTTNAMLAERTAKMCLLGPNGETFAQADKLAARSVELGSNDQYLTYFEFARAFASYRERRWDAATEWLDKSRQHNQIKADYIWYLVAMNHLVQAMTHHQMNEPDKARQSLQAAEEVIEQKLPKHDSGDLGVSWFDWLMCDLLRREARGLIAK